MIMDDFGVNWRPLCIVSSSCGCFYQSAALNSLKAKVAESWTKLYKQIFNTELVKFNSFKILLLLSFVGIAFFYTLSSTSKKCCGY